MTAVKTVKLSCYTWDIQNILPTKKKEKEKEKEKVMEVFTAGTKYTQLMPDAFQALLLNCTLINHHILDIVNILYIFLQYPVHTVGLLYRKPYPPQTFSNPGRLIFFVKRSHHFPCRNWVPVWRLNTGIVNAFPASAQTPQTNWWHFINSPTQQFQPIFHNPISTLTARGQPIPT